jgi:hypothetical protein
MENIRAAVEGNELVIRVDLSKSGRPSKGKVLPNGVRQAPKNNLLATSGVSRPLTVSLKA